MPLGVAQGNLPHSQPHDFDQEGLEARGCPYLLPACPTEYPCQHIQCQEGLGTLPPAMTGEAVPWTHTGAQVQTKNHLCPPRTASLCWESFSNKTLCRGQVPTAQA